MRIIRPIVVVAASCALALAIVTAAPVLSAAPQSDGQPAAARCEALLKAVVSGQSSLRMLSATLNPASAAQPAQNPFAPPTPALPEHCQAGGKLNERTGVNGQQYAIAFQLRLPTTWNGRFFFQGGGGTNGNVAPALGTLQGQQPNVALALGYAVVSQDSGHDNMTNGDPARGGTQTFGFDPQARSDFGYSSYHVVTVTAKALVARYYGRPPEKSYYVGCSEGGREALMISQRYPDDYDGILACSPGLHLPRAAVAEAWDSQAIGSVRQGRRPDRSERAAAAGEGVQRHGPGTGLQRRAQRLRCARRTRRRHRRQLSRMHDECRETEARRDHVRDRENRRLRLERAGRRSRARVRRRADRDR
jgi:feruloyl esterase